MKIIAIGDIHGRDIWKKIVSNKGPDDIVVFIGDYLDSWDVSPAEQVENFAKIIAYKKANMDSCILLIGNHDFHYMKSAGDYERYSGFNPITKAKASLLLENALTDGSLQMAYEKDGYLFTHAGVTKQWMKRAGLEQLKDVLVAHAINELFKKTVVPFRFAIGTEPTGDDPRNSPFWVRPESLEEDQIDGFNQVVGHTKMDGVRITQKMPNIIYTDVFDYKNEYVEIENGGVKIIRI